MNGKGKLISFEGGEGCGKSTQAKLLFDYFEKNKIPAILTREPGGTESGEKIRNILVTGSLDKLDKLSEVLLHYAARNEHYKKKILHALAQGKVVVTDRFYDSTFAYQGYGHQVDMKIIESIHKMVMGDFKPDLTFVFDIDPVKGLDRSERRHQQEDSNENRYENISVDFHKRLRDGFLAIAKSDPGRCIVLNGEENIDTLHVNVVETLFNKRIL